jgi:Ca-activated chloride channel family protein
MVDGWLDKTLTNGDRARVQKCIRGRIMTFAHPEFLWLMALLLPIAGWAIRGERLRGLGWMALGQRGRAPRNGTVRLIASIACLIVAIAQPRWGRDAGPPSPPGHDVVLLVDVSRSMGVEDAVPNRLGVAVDAAESLIDALASGPANRAALVAFAGRGVLRCPLSENLGAVLDALHRLRPGGVEPGGTDLGAALDAALEAIDTEEHASGCAVVLFSDGEDHGEKWSSRLDRLREEGIVVHAVAIGDSEEGHPVPGSKAGQPLVFHGDQVLSRRRDTALETIARGTGGVIVKLGLASVDLGSLYQSRIEPASRRRREASPLRPRAERFPLVLAGALALLMSGCWPARRGWGWRWWNWGWRRPVRSLALAVLLSLMLGAARDAGDSAPTVKQASAAQAVARGRSAYDAGSLDQALAAFELAIEREPRQAVPRYDAAATLFQLGRHDDARQRYLEARERADRSLLVKIEYALGNTALALGDVPAAISAYDRCLETTARGAAFDAVRRDAAINRSFALAQAQSLAVPPSASSGDDSHSKRRDPNRRGGGDDRSPDGQTDGDSGAGGATGDADDRESQQPPPAARRRMGGAAGGRSSASRAPGNSPEGRLDAALEQIRAAQSRRLAEEPPHESASNDGKDW